MEIPIVQLKIVLRILEHKGIISCLVGETALNYYNVPRVIHVFEICVSKHCVEKAQSLLCSTGLFELEELLDFDLYNEYKKGFPRLRSTGWTSPPCYIVLFSGEHFHMEPLSKTVVIQKSPTANSAYENSKQILDLVGVNDVRCLPMPRLSPLLQGLAQRYLDASDAVAMIAAEQLVDGMDVDECWAKKNLADARADVQDLITRLISGKYSRLDDFSENTVTCFLADEREAERVKNIPGYQ
ncbi:hypothetical protein EJ08DRAFT_656863 [Tothia fuscella]|uniref:Uncharacterized protein n=1 Tax=Tothia fuscella TaxID=1048955 RepID=A0A9P4U2U0_9PEZI|nr:hypothetical protein EJ08DRAFT_656863 [Tothia fuscella]